MQHSPGSFSFAPVSQVEEIEQVSQLAREIWTEHYTPIIGEQQVDFMLQRFQSPQAIRRQIAAGMVYRLMGNRSGYFAYERTPDYLFLSKIYVHRDFRGQGWAHQAIRWIEKKEHPSLIRLTVNRHNHPSLRAYEKLGFVRAGEQVSDIGNGYVMDDYVMEKQTHQTRETRVQAPSTS